MKRRDLIFAVLGIGVAPAVVAEIVAQPTPLRMHLSSMSFMELWDLLYRLEFKTSLLSQEWRL